MAKVEPEHKDILGQPLKEGNYVAVSHHNALQICQIKKINPKMLRVLPVQGNYRRSSGHLVYGGQTILLSGPDALAYILTYAGT
jgi:hypothetical protein